MVHDISASYNPTISAGLKELLGPHITYHPAIAKMLGSIPAAALLNQCIYWSLRLPRDRDGWFYKTQKDWMVEISIGPKELINARKKLRSVGVLMEDQRGVPPVIWYKVDFDRLLELSANQPKGTNQIIPKGRFESSQRDDSIYIRLQTESTNIKDSCIIDDDTCDQEAQNKPAQSNSPPIDSAGKRKRVQVDYPPEFEELFNLYPKRVGNNKKETYENYTTRLNQGHSHEDMLNGVKKYAAYVKAEKLTGTRHFKTSPVFLGPREHFLEDWTITEDKKTYSGMEQFKGRKIL